MLLVEIPDLCFEPFAILHRLPDFQRKFAHRGLMADRTFFDLGLMFGYFHLNRWHVKDLALLATFDVHFLQRSLTMTTTFHLVDSDMIGMGYSFECRTRMARLPTTFLATLIPQAFVFLAMLKFNRFFSLSSYQNFTFRRVLRNTCFTE